MKKLITLLLSLLVITSLYSLPPRSPAHSKPGKKDVIIVGKIAFTDSIKGPIEGYTKLFYPKNDSDEFNYIYFILDEGMTDSIWGAYTMNRSYKNWDFNQTFYFDNKPDKNNTVKIAAVHASLFANREWYDFFRIPLNVEITCPADAKYVYAGTFELDVDYALRVKTVNYIDDFEEAEKEVKKLYGESAKLVRGNVKYSLKN